MRRACIDYENDQKMMIELTRKNKLNEMIEVEKQRRETEEQEKFSRRLLSRSLIRNYIRNLIFLFVNRIRKTTGPCMNFTDHCMLQF